MVEWAEEILPALREGKEPDAEARKALKARLARQDLLVLAGAQFREPLYYLEGLPTMYLFIFSESLFPR